MGIYIDYPTIYAAASIPVWQVDAHNIVPCWIASDKLEYGARTIRPKIHKVYKDRFALMYRKGSTAVLKFAHVFNSICPNFLPTTHHYKSTRTRHRMCVISCWSMIISSSMSLEIKYYIRTYRRRKRLSTGMRRSLDWRLTVL